MQNPFSWFNAKPAARLAASALLLCGFVSAAHADTTPQTLPFSQNWNNTGLITTNNDWSGVPGIIGYNGAALAGSAGVDPQTVVADGSATAVNVTANQSDPTAASAGGLYEYDSGTAIAGNPVVGFQGSGSARAPHLVISLNTTGKTGIKVSYLARDIDTAAADTTVQPVALQYRVGTSGSYTNLPAGFIANANNAGTTTISNVALPAAAENQAVVQLRILTSDAAGVDNMVGIDDISFTSGGATPTPTPTVVPTPTPTVVPTPTPTPTTPPANAPTAVNDSFTVNLDSGANDLDVLANDTDPNGDTLTITATGTANKGTVSINRRSDALIYTPNSNAIGTDSFTYTISDGTNTATGTVTITIVDPDPNGPTVTVNQDADQADPTTTDSASFTAFFSKPVINFNSSDVTVSGTALYTSVTITGDSTLYTITVGGVTRAGTVIVSLAAGAVTDAAGHPNAASTSTDNTVTVNYTAPNSAPTNIALSNSSVAEGLPVGTTVGTLTTTDPDAGNTFTYSLVSGDTSAFSISSATLKTAAVFNFATKSSYSITIRTTDQGGLFFNKAFTITVTSTADTTKPVITQTSPFADQNLLISAFKSLAGSATDNIGVVGVTLKITRLRNGVVQVWNGTAWTTTSVILPATITGSGTSVTWSFTTPFPSAAQLDAGQYIIVAYAKDAKGNTGTVTTRINLFASDTTVPVTLVFTPTQNQKVLLSDFTSGAANVISGNATDNVGVNYVRLKLSRKRNNVNEYWNGTAFTTSPVLLLATVTPMGGSTVKWNMDSQMPSLAQLDSGLYQLEAYAIDVANNKSTTIVRPFTLGTDFVAPSTVITAPTQNQKVAINNFVAGTINGTATDNLGVTSVKVKLQRKRNNIITYWNGTAFTTTSATVDAVVTTVGGTSVTWKLNNVPTVAKGLDIGAYTLYASAYDAAGNTKSSASRGFTVTATASPISTAPVSSAGGS